MTDLNKEREVNLRFEQDDGFVWVFDGDSQFGTEISHLMMMHSDEYNEDELRVICNHASCEIDRLRAELEKAKAQAVQQSFEIGRLQDRITELLDERQDLYAQINNDQAVPDTHVLVEKSKIHKWYQDANEPESFSNDDSEDGLRSLGDLIDDYGIMEVEIHESALISTKKAFGVWKSKSPTDICTNFVLVETLEEAEKILADNKAMYESESGAEG
ncbi:hypothetical protein [Acinetobacter baumannii]|uniref:hypothetical protein n=1 Tax=Acinetobacter baumannii TaxID=470 RepID=UPI0024DE54A5|nr:hypothetical protein [Acinetobacter baumannii]MDK2143675.1 hypothetical protein [Acinetobacter baumannii]MDK2162264.1 hypothetical protein [Acinetobacter baumannii]MDK2173327.1 hypothetical protein [Acinetobacter baumannii]MDK2202259.1 hypothetical protein [Acinetobacter baumannii]MDK2209400.1 hypothetical protein [Acinetobacter baumannii]